MKKTLVEVCMSPNLGGLELYMVRTSKALLSDFDVISVINEDSKLESYFSENDRYKTIKKSSNIFMVGSARKLAKLIDENNVSIIHIHWTKDIPFVVLAKLFSKQKPKIVQSRHMTMTRYKDDFYHNFLYKNIDLMLPVTNQVKEQLEKFIPAVSRPRIETLYLGCENYTALSPKELSKFEDLHSIDSRCFNVGMVGRINKAKGQYLLIEAISKLKNINVKVYFVGHEMEEGYIAELQAYAKVLNVADRVVFLGFLKETNSFYEACDLVVLASENETFGLVLIEAMNSGTAVVGSDSGGVLEIIENNENGLLFQSGNSESLSQKIRLLYGDVHFKMQLASNGKSSASKVFNSSVQYQKLSRILNQS
ncbi:MAG: glycosyltransferase family 4 protein [Campylobacterota bacterium]|nr:glycosyltransferase family 4 protein [Campylobacterota bacterium]